MQNGEEMKEDHRKTLSKDTINVSRILLMQKKKKKKKTIFYHIGDILEYNAHEHPYL